MLNSIYSHKQNHIYLTSILPSNKGILNKDTELKFCVTDVMPICNSIEGSNDQRTASIALSSLTVFPLSRPVFIARKHNDHFLFNGIDYIKKYPFVRELIFYKHYESAYEHYRQNNNYTQELSEEFDECPGDLYDLLKHDAV